MPEKYDPDQHRRRSIRLKKYDYSFAGAYFVTVCACNREFVFGEIDGKYMRLNEYGLIVEKVWKSIPERFSIQADVFVIMPNHFHGIVMNVGTPIKTVGAIHESPVLTAPSKNVGAIHELPNKYVANNTENKIIRRNMLLPKIVGYFKMNSSKQINAMRVSTKPPVWQRNYFEHVIRNEDDLRETRDYIVNNPAKWYEDEYNALKRIE